MVHPPDGRGRRRLPVGMVNNSFRGPWVGVKRKKCCKIFHPFRPEWPRPPGVSAVPVAVSVIRAYWRSSHGKAMTDSEKSCFQRVMKAAMASSGKRPPLYPESFRVSLNNGAAMISKFLMRVRKKLQRPTKDLIVLTSAGALAVSMAFSLFLLGLIPSGVRVNPRYFHVCFQACIVSPKMLLWALHRASFWYFWGRSSAVLGYL